MSRPRFLADHDLNEHIVTGVLRREPAIEFSRVREFGLSGASDSAILEFAQRQGLLVVSHDVNTMTAAAYARFSSLLGWIVAWPFHGPANLAYHYGD